MPGIDHLLVAGKLKLRLKKRKPRKPKPHYDYSESRLTAYRVEVSNRFAALPIESCNQSDVDPDQQWGTIKEIVQASARLALATRPRKHKPWISWNTMQLIEEKRKLGRSDVRYKSLNGQVKKSVKADRQAAMEEACQGIERAAEKHDSRRVFEGLRRILKKVVPRNLTVRDERGILVTELVEVLDRWQRYCAELYRSEETEPRGTTSFTEKEPSPLRSEVERALHSVKAGKAPGPDAIPIELLQNGGPELFEALYRLIVTVFETGKWPVEWCETITVPILKKGDPRDCDNYRTFVSEPR